VKHPWSKILEFFGLAWWKVKPLGTSTKKKKGGLNMAGQFSFSVTACCCDAARTVGAATANSNRRRWLRRAGLIIGLVWIVWGFIVFLVSVESPLTWVILGPIFLVFLAIITIAWKWQLVGAVALIVVGLFLVVQQITGWIWTAISGAIYNPLEMLAGVLFTGGLPLASGILLLLSRKKRKAGLRAVSDGNI